MDGSDEVYFIVIAFFLNVMVLIGWAYIKDVKDRKREKEEEEG
jgi:hypothetical protein